MDQIKEQLSNTVQSVEDGNFNSLEAYANLDMLEKFIKECKNQIFDSALEEHGKHGEKTFSAFGYQFTSKNGSVKYDYDGHEELAKKEAEVKRIKDLLKNASKLGKAIVDEETGETFSPLPIKSGTKDSLSIKKIN